MPRPRKPAAIKRAKGTLRADQEGTVPEAPIRMLGEFETPAEFKGNREKKRYWRHYTTLLIELEVLSKSDRQMITLLCETTVVHDELLAAWEREPYHDMDGNLSKSKKDLHSMLLQTKSKLQSQLAACGLTPGSRSGLMRRERAKSADPWEKFS